MGTIDSWSSIEAIIRQRLDSIEIDRRYCAICGRQGPSLSRCFGCQMVYYCGEEHQAEDWSQEHGHKCAQLEWVALGEFIRALPAQPPLPELGDKWSSSLKEIQTWVNWFSIRTNIVHVANNTANIFQNLVHLTDKRQPNHQNAVDGLLAAVTDLLTHVLTIGKAIISFGLQPQNRSLLIHILNGFNKVDLIGSDHSSSNLPSRFHELLNMFPDNKGVELVIVIGDEEDDDDDEDDEDDTHQSSPPHAKLRSDRLIIATRGKGRLLDTFEEKQLQRPANVDLLVYFNAAQLFSASNRELLKTMLTKQRPTLLTFDDEEEFNQARAYFASKSIPIKQAGSNPFSSLMIQQRSSRPNSTYSTNSYQILLNAIKKNPADERLDDKTSLLSRQRAHQSSIGIQHGHEMQLQQQQQQHQLNPGSKQVNGKTHFESLSSSSPLSHNTQANNNGTLLDTNVHIGSTSNATTTVQSSVRSNNHIRQPAIAQRRHHSPAIASSPASVTPSTIYTEVQPTALAVMNMVESTRHDLKPQPKPRMSLVKSTSRDQDPFVNQAPRNIVERIKPFFEQPPVQAQQEAKQVRQPRPPVSIPYTYQSVVATKVTCLDDLLPAKRIDVRSPSPPHVLETHNHDRTVAAAPIVSTSSLRETRNDQRNATVTPTDATQQLPRSSINGHADQQTNKSTVNVLPSSSTMPIEIHHDQRSIVNRTSIASSPTLAVMDNRFDERVVAAAPVNVPTKLLPPTETAIDQFVALPTSPTPSFSLLTRAPPPPPLTLPSTTAANEVIYTEVIKSHERPSSAHPTEILKSPLSPSRSFVMPTKSPSISSKNPSFNLQRQSRPISTATTTNFSYQTHKPRPLQSSMNADRISLYSQRSNKQADMGVTIKNLSECIDRVGIVYDERSRPFESTSAGLTTVDLIREQLTSSSPLSKPTESLLDKLHKSNSSTRLASSTTRTQLKLASPRSKSQQATRHYDEPPAIAKTTPTPAPAPPIISATSVRRTTGIFLPFTPKPVQESVPTPVAPPAQSPTLVYQNLEPHHATLETKPSRSIDYTLKQPTGPLCTGIPRPFRKPTAIIEPSPVLPASPPAPSEPNYVNLTHDDAHIYTNENGTPPTASSNSNSYTSKTSSIYSSSDKAAAAAAVVVHPEPLYAVSNVLTLVKPEEQSVDYDSFDDELMVGNNQAQVEQPLHSHDNTDDDSFDDDENQNDSPLPAQLMPTKNASTGFFRSTLNRLTRSNKSLDRLGLNNDSVPSNDFAAESNPSNGVDLKTKKTLRSIKARHEAKKTGTLLSSFNGDDDTTSIDSNCSTQTATSLNKASKPSHQRFRLFRRKIEKEFASDTEAEKHQTEQRRKKWNKKMSNDTADELKNKRLLMMSDDDDDEQTQLHRQQQQHQKQSTFDDETHIYDHIIHDEITNHSSRMGKLSHETHVKSPTVTLDEIRSELQAEIAARQETPMKNSTNTTATTMTTNLTLQKKRSKSVTFLDELLVDDSPERQTGIIRKNDLPLKTSTNVKRIEKGDARSICGALTGTGPIRGIIKAANNGITGTTAPVSPSAAAAAIYLSGPSVDTRCTSPKASERTHRPMSTYTVGSARFYDGSPIPPPPVPPPSSSSHQHSNVSNQRPILTNGSSHSSSDNVYPKRPTAKVSPFQTKSPNDSSPSPINMGKQAPMPSSAKKPVRPTTYKNPNLSHDISSVATPSISDGVGGVSKRLQSNL